MNPVNIKDPTERILEGFQALNRIPRGSGNIDPPFQYLTGWAEKQGFKYKTDAVQNILIQVPGSPGYENSPVVVLQGHMDMVCEKIPGSKHDFLKDPIENYIDGDWLKARETSLGADNGIALAIAFDLALNPEVKHPPLEILITTEEEVGMDGAGGLASDFLEGRILLNLDSEDEGIFTIGCAGGCDSYFTFPADRQKAAGWEFHTLILDGLQGGHSGMDIHKGRGSAMEMSGRLIHDLAQSLKGRLVSIESGSGATNAIARRAELEIAVEKGRDLQSWVAQWEKDLQVENHVVEPRLSLSLEPHSAKSGTDSLEASSVEATLRLGQFMMSLPQGVFRFSRDIEGLVETSSNIAGVRTTDKGYSFFGSQRSSVNSRLRWIRDRVTALADLAGCVDIRVKNKYPAWQPNPDSPLLARSVKLYKELFGKEPVVEAIHAGLEAGLIGDKYPGMDMLSIGPTMVNPHSPDEALFIPSLEPFYRFLAALLADLR